MSAQILVITLLSQKKLLFLSNFGFQFIFIFSFFLWTIGVWNWEFTSVSIVEMYLNEHKANYLLHSLSLLFIHKWKHTSHKSADLLTSALPQKWSHFFLWCSCSGNLYFFALVTPQIKHFRVLISLSSIKDKQTFYGEVFVELAWKWAMYGMKE